MAEPITHGSCSKTWTGTNRSHCAACHETFSTDGTAERHRVGTFGVDRRCAHPADIGLVQRPNGVWGGAPMTDEQKLRMSWARKY